MKRLKGSDYILQAKLQEGINHEMSIKNFYEIMEIRIGLIAPEKQ